MGYHVIDPGTITPTDGRPSTTRDIQAEIGLEHLGLRQYTVEPGEDIPVSGMHLHETQEEVFYVIDGTLRVETPETVYTVERGQFFIAEPESPHRAFNDSEENCRVIGMGAPKIEDGRSV